jgi:peptidoglycan/LPS O-acetylase OafA/YrhL
MQGWRRILFWYLSHVIVLSVIGRFWLLFATEGYWDNIIVLSVMVIAILVVGYISYLFIERTMLKNTRKLEKRFFSNTKQKTGTKIIGLGSYA